MSKEKNGKIIKKETPTQRLSDIIKSCRKIMRKDKGMNGDADRLPMLTWIMFLKFLDDNEQLQEVTAKLEGKKYKAAIDEPYRWRDWAKDKNLTGDDLLDFVTNEKVKLADGKERIGLFHYLRGLQSESGTERKDVIATVFKGVINRMINGYLLRDVVDKIDEIHFTNNEEINTLSHLYESILKEMRDASGDAGEFYTPRPVVKFMVEMVDPKIGETVLDPAAGTGGFLVESFEHIKKQAKTVEQKKVLQTTSIIGGEAKPLPYLLCQMNLLLHGLNYPNIDPLNSLRFPLREIGDRDRVDIILTNPPFAGEEEKGILNNFPDDKRSSETAWLFLQLIMRKLKKKSVNYKGGRAAVVVPDSGLFDSTGIATRIKQDLLSSFNLHTIVRFPKGVFEPYTDIETNVLFFDCSAKTETIWYYQIQPPVGKKNFTKTLQLENAAMAEVKEWFNNRVENLYAWSVPVSSLDWKELNLDIKNPNGFDESENHDTGMVIKSLKKNLSIIQNTFETITTSVEILQNNLESVPTPLTEILIRRKDEIEIEDDEEYKRITIRLYGNGIEIRDIAPGTKIGTKKQFIVTEGQLVLSKIDAGGGAFGILPTECDGAIITGNFWAYDINTKRVEPEYLKLLITSRKFLNFCKGSSTGTTNRKYLDESKFLKQEVLLPDTKIQKKIVSAFRTLDNLSKSSKQFEEKSGFLFHSLIDKIV
jgi:type I restriction enzyme M protein